MRAVAYRSCVFAAAAVLVAAAGCGSSRATRQSDAGTDSGTGTDSGIDAAVPPLPFEWIGVLGSGQSLAVGAEGEPVIHASSSYGNLMLSDPRALASWDGLGGDGDGLEMIPLAEPIRPLRFPVFGQYPDNIAGETFHLMMGDEASAIEQQATGRSLVTVHSVTGVSGMPLAAIARGGVTNAYLAAMFEARVITARAAAAGHTFGYGAIVFTHGETDASNANYGASLYQWWQTMNMDLRAITGQTREIPLLLTQQSSMPWPASAMDPQRSTSTQGQWQLSVDHPGQVVLVGPKYQYAASLNLVHLTAAGYRALGIKNAEAFHRVVIEQQPWEPLEPTAVVRNGNVIRATFHVPSPPLQWDDSIPPPHQAGMLHPAWANGRGFEVSDSTGDLMIHTVAIDHGDVVITLAAAPTGTDVVVRYAMTPEAYGGRSGPLVGRRGQLRDSDPFQGIDRRTVMVHVNAGDPIVSAAPGGTTFERMGEREVVTGASLAEDTIIASVSAPMSLTLSSAWTGPSGTQMLAFGQRGDVRVSVTHGSTDVRATGEADLREVDAGDPVTVTNAPTGLTVASLAPHTELVLSRPWTGPTGTAPLTFRSDQRNYCVQFEWPL